MDNKELNQIALQTAKSILKAEDQQVFMFRLKGGVKEWDESVYKNVFEVVYNVFKKTNILELEMNPVTGEVLNCKEIEKGN